jgi:hypothetical protein
MALNLSWVSYDKLSRKLFEHKTRVETPKLDVDSYVFFGLSMAWGSIDKMGDFQVAG